MSKKETNFRLLYNRAAVAFVIMNILLFSLIVVLIWPSKGENMRTLWFWGPAAIFGGLLLSVTSLSLEDMSKAFFSSHKEIVITYHNCSGQFSLETLSLLFSREGLQISSFMFVTMWGSVALSMMMVIASSVILPVLAVKGLVFLFHREILWVEKILNDSYASQEILFESVSDPYDFFKRKRKSLLY